MGEIIDVNTNAETLNREINRLKRLKWILIIVGISISAICIALILGYYYYQATQTVMISGDISEEDSLSFTFLDLLIGTILPSGITIGAAIAIAGGITCHIKVNNRRKLLVKKEIKNDYGSNGIEY